MHLIDTHCHLDSFFNPNLIDTYLQEAFELNVKQMIAVGTNDKDWGVYQHLSTNYPKTIFYTVGLHPCYLTDKNASTLECLEPFFYSSNPPVALGECGLDYYRLPEDPESAQKEKNQQKKAFLFQIQLAKKLDCPLIVHSRFAFLESIDCLQSCDINPEKVIFHCFSEGEEAMQILMDNKYRASFTGILTYKKAHNVRSALIKQGLSKLILETDAPWLAPEPKRGKDNKSAYLWYTAEKVAQIFDVSLEDVCKISTENAQNFFNLK